MKEFDLSKDRHICDFGIVIPSISGITGMFYVVSVWECPSSTVIQVAKKLKIFKSDSVIGNNLNKYLAG